MDHQCIEGFLTFSEGILSEYSNLMFMGDFNIHIIEDGYYDAVQDFNNCICDATCQNQALLAI